MSFDSWIDIRPAGRGHKRQTGQSPKNSIFLQKSISALPVPISYKLPVVWYSFVLNSASTVVIDTLDSPDNLDPKIGIFDIHGSLVAFNDDYDGNINYLSKITLNALNPGIYFLAVGFTNLDFGNNFQATLTQGNWWPSTWNGAIRLNFQISLP